MFWLLVRRDLVLALRRPAALLLPVMFFVLAAALFPFAVGPDLKMLAKIAPGVLWVSALLATLLPVETLVAPDLADGTIDQLVSRGVALETFAVARMTSHWLGFALPLLAALPVAAVLLGAPALGPLALGLLLGTPALAALALLAASLTAGLRGGGALAGLIVLPLALPVLIFGVGIDAPGALQLLAAASLVMVAVVPFAAAAALRAGME
jgi:heme exporter protein B